jgi:hypothetical protein
VTRYENEAIETKVQVLDSNDDPATGAVVLFRILDESDATIETGVMTHIIDGIFTYTWTPDEPGEWVFEAYSTNPKFRDSRAYWIEPAPP